MHQIYFCQEEEKWAKNACFQKETFIDIYKTGFHVKFWHGIFFGTEEVFISCQLFGKVNIKRRIGELETRCPSSRNHWLELAASQLHNVDGWTHVPYRKRKCKGKVYNFRFQCFLTKPKSVKDQTFNSFLLEFAQQASKWQDWNGLNIFVLT